MKLENYATSLTICMRACMTLSMHGCTHLGSLGMYVWTVSVCCNRNNIVQLIFIELGEIKSHLNTAGRKSCGTRLGLPFAVAAIQQQQPVWQQQRGLRGLQTSGLELEPRGSRGVTSLGRTQPRRHNALNFETVMVAIPGWLQFVEPQTSTTTALTWMVTMRCSMLILSTSYVTKCLVI